MHVCKEKCTKTLTTHWFRKQTHQRQNTLKITCSFLGNLYKLWYIHSTEYYTTVKKNMVNLYAPVRKMHKFYLIEKKRQVAEKHTYMDWFGGFPSGSAVKNPPAMQKPQETQVRSLGLEDPLEEGMATHSSILAWRIPWTEEPGRLQSVGLQKGQTWLKWLGTWNAFIIHGYKCICICVLAWKWLEQYWNFKKLKQDGTH